MKVGGVTPMAPSPASAARSPKNGTATAVKVELPIKGTATEQGFVAS